MKLVCPVCDGSGLGLQNAYGVMFACGRCKGTGVVHYLNGTPKGAEQLRGPILADSPEVGET